MSKIAPRTVPTPRAGQPANKPGVVSGVAKFVPQELDGTSNFGNRLVQKPARRQMGGGGLSVSTVEVLPEIPATGARFVYWTSVGAGTGDDQIWVAYAGQDRWYALQRPSLLSGIPV
jgi:hypothetical protein